MGREGTAEQSRWQDKRVGLASQRWLIKDPMTERLLAKGVGETLGNPRKKAPRLRNVSFSDLSAAGYVVGIDFFFLIKFHSDFLKKKNEHRCMWRQMAWYKAASRAMGHSPLGEGVVPPLAAGRCWGWASRHKKDTGIREVPQTSVPTHALPSHKPLWVGTYATSTGHASAGTPTPTPHLMSGVSPAPPGNCVRRKTTPPL